MRPYPLAVFCLLASQSVLAISFQTRLEKVEFLGAYCLARLSGAGLGDQGLTAVVSPHFMAEHALSPGHTLALQLRPQRLRLFSGAQAT